MTAGRGLRPAEGWTVIGLVVFMCLTLAWSLDDAAWVLGRKDLTDFLFWVIILGVSAGIVTAKLGWRRWPAHLASAAAAALIVPTIVGSVLSGGAGSPFDWFGATATSSVEAVLDLGWRGKQLTDEVGHFLLVLGLLSWSAGQFAGYATFGHRRPLSAAVLIGMALLANMALTPRDQLIYLVLFSLAALFMLVQLHTFDEQGTWIRRRIGDPASVSALYLKGGATFVTIAVISSLFLTTSASSAPLAGAWTGVDRWLIDVGQGLQRYFSFVQSVRGPTGVVFGSAAPITGRWVTDDSVAATIRVSNGETRRPYWRAAVYNDFSGAGWSWNPSETTQLERDPGQPALVDAADEPADAGHAQMTFNVTPVGFRAATILSPNTPVSVSEATTVSLIGDAGRYVTIDGTGSIGPYSVTALVPIYGDEDPAAITANKLRVAGTNYPTDIRSLYLGVPEGILGPESLALKEEVRAGAAADNPYDIATRFVDVLQARPFEYRDDVTDLDCGSRSRVECFVHYKLGYCQHYASTMAMILRDMGIPTRLAQGFLPGERDEASGIETLRFSNSHAWVEVFFPGYGWVEFDPTGGSRSQRPTIPEGTFQPLPSTSAGASGDPGDDVLPGRPSSRDGGGFGNRDDDDTAVPGTTARFDQRGYVAIAVLMLIALGFLGFLAYRRGPRGTVEPDAVYRGLTRLATRLGFAPRPTQTVFEYTGALGEVLPIARRDLAIVANAKVEVAYSRRPIEDDGLRRLREAHRRLRVTLLRLLFRRRGPRLGRPIRNTRD